MNLTKIDRSSRILVTGGTGLVGRALTEALLTKGFTNVVSVGTKDCDLRDSIDVRRLMNQVSPDYVFHLAARVHGIGGNLRYKSDVLVDNVFINTNVVEFARQAGVKKIVAMGSGCVYPELKGVDELTEDQIWMGPPHSSEDSYAHSKRVMLAQLEAANQQYGTVFAFAISGNLYGPYDSFNVEEGHVIPSLVAKFHNAKDLGVPVRVWGSGSAVRDFSFCEDTAFALIDILHNVEGPVNMGSGLIHSIKDIVDILQNLTGVEVEWDSSKPDGQLVRYYNLDKLTASGFKAKTSLKKGVERTYRWYEENWMSARK